MVPFYQSQSDGLLLSNVFSTLGVGFEPANVNELVQIDR